MGDLYASTKVGYVYRIFDPINGKYCSSGHSLYGKGRTIWANLGGVTNAKSNMPEDIRERVVIMKFRLVPVIEE